MSDAPGRPCRVVGDVVFFDDKPKPQVYGGWPPRDRAAVDRVEPTHHAAGELPIGTEVRMQVSRDRVVTVEAATAVEPSAAVELAAVSAVPTVTAPAPARAVESDELGFTHVQVGSDLVAVEHARRLPQAFELFVNATCETQAKVFAVRWPSVPVYACAAVKSGVVFLNESRLRPSCPLLWLSTLVHEAHHVREKHVTPGEDEAEESAADAEAKFVLTGLALSVDRKSPPVGETPIDPLRCVACYEHPGGRCRQSESTRGRVHAAFEKYCDPLGS
jgi:hypothetical protein